MNDRIPTLRQAQVLEGIETMGIRPLGRAIKMAPAQVCQVRDACVAHGWLTVEDKLTVAGKRALKARRAAEARL